MKENKINTELTSREKAIKVNSEKEANIIKSEIKILLKILFFVSLIMIFSLSIIF